jgi:carboxyl-terminal processing protease
LCLTAACLALAAPSLPAAENPSAKPDALRDREKDIEELKRFSQVLNIVERHYVNEVTRSGLIDGAVKGMLQSLDPHSTLLNKEEFKEMKETTSGEFFGIGIEITMEGSQVVVVTPIEDTPAYKAGFKPGDLILSVDGQPTMDMGLQDVVSRIRGPKGTEVELVFMHRDDKSPTTVTIKRDAIPLISVKTRELEPGYHWMRLTRFSERTTQELLDALDDINKKGSLKGLVLDLRNNPGGLLDQAVRTADCFLRDGLIVSVRGRDEQANREFQATEQKTDVTVPVVVLVNAGSASAAEIVAGALGDQKRALLLGERTFGKGSVQHIIPLPDASGVKLTVALYYTPSGRSIQAEGIVPDIVVPFEIPRDEDGKMSSRFLREQDLRRHLEVDRSGKAKESAKENEDADKERQAAKDKGKKNQKDRKPDAVSAEAWELLERDNQLRMGLQFVKNLPKLRQIQ